MKNGHLPVDRAKGFGLYALHIFPGGRAGHPSDEVATQTIRSILGQGRFEMSQYAVVFEKTSTGFSAYLPDLPGCIATGRSLDETKRLIQEAVDMHLGAMRRDGDEIPEPSLIDYVRA